MYHTPLKNSKNVSKPFKSPFDPSTQSKDQSKSCDRKRKINNEVDNSPLVTKCNLVAKRVLMLDEEENDKILNTPELNNANQNSLKLTSDTLILKKKKFNKEEKDKKKLKVVDSNTVDFNSAKKLTQCDLLMLKKKTFEVRQEIESIKSREMCTKKHNPQELRDSIKKWRTACQSALEILCSETSKRNGQSMKISDILSMLNIPETLVHYSEKDDSFN
ncbi:uncharacterized protein LOC131672913 isoform X2 [Phymastichus coffea]|uniref:uncharacterized protein LOC131672913 isoform X2 n=1 Tax=Phymastichus coffea TaxID=108790 RepID=UPI00273C6905|nr:uncharacterized protein LOC131672913 isoform X2 [Phymastichus coffea]